MSDLNYIDRDGEVKIVGQDATGNTVNYVSADANGNLFVRDYSDGSVTAGTAASVSSLIGGQFNTALPTLTNTQQSAIQLDSSGRLIIRPLTSADVVSAAQSGSWTTGRTWTLASGTDSVSAVQSGTWNIGTLTSITNPVAVTQSGTWTVQQGTPPWTIQGDSASGASKAGNPVQIGGVFNTTQPTVTTGQTVEAQSTARGALIVSTGVDNFNINNISGTVSLPTGAATSALQTTGNNTLTTINTTLGSPFQAGGSIGNTTFASTQSGTWTVQPGNTANTTAWFVKDNSLGTVAAGTAGTQSSLAGGVFNTALPTLTTGQQAALQLDSSGRLIISPLSSTSTVTVSNLPTTVDTNYGAVGASTIRTASQIGNATGAALFGAGTTTAQVLRVVLPTDQTAIPASQSGTWNIGTLTTITNPVAVTQSTSPWAISAASLPLPTGAATEATLAKLPLAQASTTSGQSGVLAQGAVTTAAPTYVTGQTDPLSLNTAGGLRVDGSGVTQPISAASLPLPTGAATSALQTTGNTSLSSIDTKTPALGQALAAASTPVVLTAAQLITLTPLATVAVTQSTSPWVISGTTTAAEDKNYGTVGANTLRTASQIGNATGAADFNAGATGAQTLRVVANQGAAGASAWLTTDAADGPVTPGTAATKSMLAGGQYNSTAPTLTTGQQSALQLNSTGQLLVAATLVDYFPATQNITVQDTATVATAIANGQSAFTGTPTAGSAATFTVPALDTVVVEVTGTWTGTLQIEVSPDNGTTWYIRPIHQAGGSSSGSFGSFTANFAGGCNVAAYTNFRVRATTAFTGTATVRVNESVNVNSVFIAAPVKLADASNNVAKITASGDLQTADIVNVSGQYRAQSVTTSAAEALGAASILANRKSLTVTPTNGTVYWGYSNAVTTSSGTPIFKNQTVAWAIGSSVHVYLIAGSTVDCRITEGS